MIDPSSPAAVSVQSRVLDLSDLEAAAVLRLVLERQHRLPDPQAARELADCLAQAALRPIVLEPPDPSVHTETGTRVLPLPQRSRPVSNGDLARETLLYLLSEEPAREPAVVIAIVQAQSPLADLARAPALDLGALVVLALRNELALEIGDAGHWQFRVHQKALNDASLAAVLANLIAALSQPGGR